MFKNKIERLVEKKQRLLFQKEQLKDRHTIREANFENKSMKIKNKKYQEQQDFDAKLKKIDLAIKKTKDQIVLEKAFVSGLDKD